MGRGGAINWSDYSVYRDVVFSPPSAEFVPLNDVTFTPLRNYLDPDDTHYEFNGLPEHAFTDPLPKRPHEQVQALEKIYESEGRQNAVNQALDLALVWTQTSEKSNEQVLLTRKEISEVKAVIEEMAVTLAAREKVVEAHAAELPQKRTACLEASNEWQKLVTVTNAASREKAALLYEQMYMGEAIDFYRGTSGYPLFLSPNFAEGTSTDPPIQMVRSRGESWNGPPSFCNCDDEEIEQHFVSLDDGCPISWEYDAQFVKYKTKYEDAVAAFNKSQKVLAQLELQHAVLKCKEYNLAASISAANSHIEQLEESIHNCEVFLTKAVPGIQLSRQTKETLLAELQHLRVVTKAKRDEVQMLEQAWPGPPCVNNNGGDSGPTPYRWSTLEVAIDAKSAAAAFQRALIEAKELPVDLLEDLFRVSVENEIVY